MKKLFPDAKILQKYFSYILDANLSVYEHQSTICPNMPVRSLIYFSVTLNDIIRKRNVYGRNPELMDNCNVLKEYSIFVDYVRFYYAQNNYNDLGTSTNQAIDRCIKENILKEFLIENCAEVVKVTQLDYTFERQLELEIEEAISEVLYK